MVIRVWEAQKLTMGLGMFMGGCNIADDEDTLKVTMQPTQNFVIQKCLCVTWIVGCMVNSCLY